MYGDYIDAIIRAYHHIAAANPRFAELKRVALKNHCKAMCNERYNTRDEIFLRNFFGSAEGKNGYLRVIGRCSADRFRPLISILKGETSNPQSEFVELLAWMFDIQPRPFNDKTDYTKIAYAPPQEIPALVFSEPVMLQQAADVINKGDKGKEGNIKENEPFTPEKPERKWKIIAMALVILISGLIGFTLLTNKKPLSQSFKNAECMYWAGDHYESSPCIQRGGDTVLIPVDPVKLHNFRRITDSSSITSNSIGKVWYRIKNGSFEFYNSPGTHPVDIQITLRRLTENSYKKYLATVGR